VGLFVGMPIADVRFIRQFLGHGSLDTATIYLHLSTCICLPASVYLHLSTCICLPASASTCIYLRFVPGRLKEDYDRAMPEIATGLGPVH